MKKIALVLLCILLSVITASAQFMVSRDTFLFAHNIAKNTLYANIICHIKNVLNQAIQSPTPHNSLKNFIGNYPDFPVVQQFYTDIILQHIEHNCRASFAQLSESERDEATKEACDLLYRMLQCMHPVGNSVCIAHSRFTSYYISLLK